MFRWWNIQTQDTIFINILDFLSFKMQPGKFGIFENLRISTRI